MGTYSVRASEIRQDWYVADAEGQILGRVAGRKRDNKIYFRHSLYPGGHSLTRFRDLQADQPEEIVRLAVKGMLPRNRLGRAMMKKLKIYAGTDHPHVAQMPRPFPWSDGKLMTGGE